jgi:hypothetical protein
VSKASHWILAFASMTTKAKFVIVANAAMYFSASSRRRPGPRE